VQSSNGWGCYRFLVPRTPRRSIRQVLPASVVTDLTKFMESSAKAGARLALLGAVLNALLSAVKIAAGVMGNSYVLIADGIESWVDIASSFVIWGGLRLAAKAPDETHPYGHGKAEPVAALIVSFITVGVAVVLAVESLHEIFTPHPSPKAYTLLVLVVVIATKFFLSRSVSAFGQRARSTAIQTDAWHHRSDAIVSSLAFVGISVGVIGGRGYETADDWAALIACGVIAYNGYRFFKASIYDIMDTAPPSAIKTEVCQCARSVSGVLDIEKCRVRKMGLDYYVDIHVLVDRLASVEVGHRIGHNVKNVIRSSHSQIADVLVHIEPATAPKR
jgi:cation diffusion facilitator family transporter